MSPESRVPESGAKGAAALPVIDRIFPLDQIGPAARAMYGGSVADEKYPWWFAIGEGVGGRGETLVRGNSKSRRGDEAEQREPGRLAQENVKPSAQRATSKESRASSRAAGL